jgi:hypothetical protein
LHKVVITQSNNFNLGVSFEFKLSIVFVVLFQTIKQGVIPVNCSISSKLVSFLIILVKYFSKNFLINSIFSSSISGNKE